MNKKFISFVLAAVLAISLGSSSAFALHVGSGIRTDSDGRINIKVESEDNSTDINAFASNKLGDLVTVFGYAAGVMTYTASKTSVQFYDSNGMKVSYAVSKDANTGKYNYEVQTFSLSGSDWAKISKCAGKDDAEKLRNFLTNELKIPEAALKTAKTDENGNLVNAKGERVKDEKEAATVWAAWLTDLTYGDEDVNATKWLQGGVNRTATVNLASATNGQGPQITLSENGKAQFTIGTDRPAKDGSEKGKPQAYVATEYVYNDAGFLTEQLNAKLERETDSEGKVSYKVTHTTTHMDATGKATHITDENGKTVGKYTYTENGSTLSFWDGKTNNTTWYSGGVASYVTNDKGSLVMQYFYQNGISQGYRSYSNGVVTSVTANDEFGRELGTYNGEASFAKVKNEINDVLTGKKSIKDTKLTDVKVYSDYVGKYDSFLNKCKNVNFNTLASTTYGYTSAIANVNIAEGKASTSGNSIKGDYYYVKVDGKWRLMTSEEKKKYLKSAYGGGKTLNADGIKKFGAVAGNFRSIHVGEKTVTGDSGKKYKYVSMSKSDIEWLEKNMDTGSLGKKADGNAYYINPADSSKFFSALGVANAGGSVSNQNWTSDGVATRLGSTYTTPGYDACLTVTSYVQGIATKQTKTYVNPQEGGYQTIDPAVVGTVKNIVTINGKQYAVLENAQVDIADGKGFQSAEGEEIYVCIDDLSDEEKAQLKPGKTFAAAGYIDTSADGHYAINNLYTHEISGSDVQNMVQSFATTLAGNAEYQANVQMNMATFAKAAAEGKTYKDWKGGWQLLVEYGGGAPALF